MPAATDRTDLARLLASIREQVERGDIDSTQASAMMARLQGLRRAARAATWDPYPWQVPPGPVPTMGTWLMLGGRGTGKTDGGSHYVDKHAMGPPCDPRLPGGHRMAIIAPTLGDASESCVTGPSGLQTVNPGIKRTGGIGGSHLTWPNGATARLFGAYTPEDVERLRAGGNRCLVWMEESAAMRHLDPALEHTSLGLRLGKNPHYVMSTTPKPRKELKRLMADPLTLVTRGSTRDAIHLDQRVRDVLFARYEGTRLGRQELDAELLTDVEGALWSWDIIDDWRVPAAPVMDRVVVAVDPGGTSEVAGRETGIVVCGRAGQDGYVLADRSGSFTPTEWAGQAISVAKQYRADAIIVEKNYGGEMTVSTIRTHPGGGDIPIIPVNAKQGKRARAEPVVGIYEQHRVHHVGVMSGLETQLTEWIPDESGSPDRLDALVHALTHLLVKSLPATVSTAAGRRITRGPAYGLGR